MGNIRTKKELDFYIKADRMKNRGYLKKTMARKVYELFIPDVVH